MGAIEPDAFDEEEVKLLSELADDLAYGITNLRMRVEHQAAEATIARLAYYDSLTELPNRNFMLERLQDAIQIAKHHHHPLALFIKHFMVRMTVEAMLYRMRATRSYRWNFC
ncbi:MAG: diguanylate cyclase domain-containing protein [Nitrosomonas sp.]